MNDLNIPDEITLRWKDGTTLTLDQDGIPDVTAMMAQAGGYDIAAALRECSYTMARFALFAEETLKANSGGAA